jgi:integrase
MAKVKGLYKRGRVWWIRYAGPDGKIRFESSRSSSFKGAQALLIERKKAVMEGSDSISVKQVANYSFQELAGHYLTWAERQRSFHTSKKFVIPQLHDFFAQTPLKGFTTRMVEAYQTKLLAEKKSAATANRHLATLKHMFTKAVEWDMVDEETAKRVRRVQLLPEHNQRLRYLSGEECQALINACSAHLKPIIITALHTGMRKEEILSLEWERHVDLMHGFLLLDVTKNGERREIPINQTLRKTLQALTRRVDSPHVFADGKGKRFQDVKKAFHSACRRAGIHDFRFHDLRHTFASHLVMAGVDLPTLKELLGHKNLTMTLRYAHLAPSHKVNALSRLELGMGKTSTVQKLYTPMKKGLTQLS